MEKIHCTSAGGILYLVATVILMDGKGSAYCDALR